jgi:sterol desaturase/sphingolipid hydroxylase (fatty acid hydroxylase superfamily)
MRISKYGYYGDFFVYPVLIGALALCSIFKSKGFHLSEWLLLCVSGLFVWSLAEYCLHRFVFHHFPFIKNLHDAHHTDPTALIGSPTWLSVAIGLIILFTPLVWSVGFMVASATLIGFMTGYLLYVSVHHLNHHAKKRHGTYFYWAKRRHALHHHCGETKNFGITTDCWDLLFGTEHLH